jgi:hypothetical protein
MHPEMNRVPVWSQRVANYRQQKKGKNHPPQKAEAKPVAE